MGDFSTPRAAPPVRRVAQNDRDAARDGHFHELTGGKEPERVAVGRPERLLGAFRAD